MRRRPLGPSDALIMCRSGVPAANADWAWFRYLDAGSAPRA
ncbi:MULTISPECIES: hypothetical protein [Acidiphilium]|nr:MULTISPECIES: hypothetical protein [Acidiphilium]HQT83850.1 hypothetical protein [Acidiphilium rubrum]